MPQFVLIKAVYLSNRQIKLYEDTRGQYYISSDDYISDVATGVYAPELLTAQMVFDEYVRLVLELH